MYLWPAYCDHVGHNVFNHLSFSIIYRLQSSIVVKLRPAEPSRHPVGLQEPLLTFKVVLMLISHDTARASMRE